MKRKSIIITTIISIIIISLMLLGITYGFYATQIRGNKSAKSIEVTTGESVVTYTDLTEENIEETIMPGYTHTKLFTIQNTGNIRAKYSIYLSEVQNNFNRLQDITYILYRKTGNNTIDITTFEGCEIIATGTFPTIETAIKTNEIIENIGDYYTYALKITYIDSYENQNIDQGKTFSAKVHIRGIM